MPTWAPPDAEMPPAKTVRLRISTWAVEGADIVTPARVGCMPPPSISPVPVIVVALYCPPSRNLITGETLRARSMVAQGLLKVQGFPSEPFIDSQDDATTGMAEKK